jgi:hypothetical protein
MPQPSRKEIYKRFVKLIKDREKRKREVAAKICKFEKEMGELQFKSQWAVFEQVAKKLNLDIDDVKAVIKETNRRHRIEGKMVQKRYAEITKSVKRQMKSEIKRKAALRKRYLKLHGRAIKARAGNPELKFMQPEGHWENSYPPDRGMHGWGFGEPDNGSWNYETTMAPDYDYEPGDDPNHMFYPHARVDTGDNDNPMELEIQQCVVLSRRPLEEGRGRFVFSRIRVDLSGVGLSQARMGDSCGRGHNWWANTQMTFSLLVSQFDPVTGFFLEDDVLVDYALPMGSGNHVDLVNIELGTRISPHDAFIDNSGAELWMNFILNTTVSAADKNAFSEINFSRDDSTGLRLGCVTLIGEYER